MVRLEKHHEGLLKDFSSNEESIDHWLQHSALEQSTQLRTSTWLCLDAQGKLCAFFSLAMSIVTAPYEKLSSTQRKRWGVDERGFAPAILIAKLGLRHDYHGRKLGKALIDPALSKCLETAEVAACALIVVDALKEELVGFYMKNGFISLDGLRLVLPMRTAQKRLASHTNGRQG